MRGDGIVKGEISICTSSVGEGSSGGAWVPIVAAIGPTIGKGAMCSSSTEISAVGIDKFAELDGSTRFGMSKEACELQDIIKDNWMQNTRYMF